MERIVGSHYRLRRRIGAGSFGEIYSAENTRSHRRVAVKLESVRTRVPQLSYESKLYAIFSGGTGIPRLHWYGTEDSHNIMVIDLLGKSLEDLFVYCHHKLSLKTVLMLVDQMISCVEFIHNKSFIHRDIKPDNFVMGLGQNSTQVFIIDYGLSKKYRDQHTHVHIPYVEGKSLTGTARYASVGALKGVEQSRRDDMESLGFVWMYLLRGSLPWMGLNGRDQKQKYDRIRDVKAKTPFEELCRGYPEEFVKYFHDVRSLKFTDKPHYAEYRQMFRDLFIRLGYMYDYKYDWCRETPSRSAPTPQTSNLTPNLISSNQNQIKERQHSQLVGKKGVQLNVTSTNITSHNTKEEIPSSTLVNVRSQSQLLATEDQKHEAKVQEKDKTENQDQKEAPRLSLKPKQNTTQTKVTSGKPEPSPRNNETEPTSPRQRNVKRTTHESGIRPVPQSALVGVRGDKELRREKNTTNNYPSKYRTTKDPEIEPKPIDSSRREKVSSSRYNSKGVPQPQSQLAGRNRTQVNTARAAPTGMTTTDTSNQRPSMRRETTTAATARRRTTMGTAHRPTSGQKDNSIQRTLMRTWMDDKPKNTRTNTHRKAFYHI